VGSTKSGTSWFYRQLVRHPDCYFRTIKELHYFNTMQSERPDYMIKKLDRERLRLRRKIVGESSSVKLRLRRRIVDLRQWSEVLGQRTENLAAYSAYLMANRGSRRVVGEVTPAYATLPVETLRRMADMAEDVRIVYLMRDPVARLWSHVRMLAARQKNSATLFDQFVTEKFEAMMTTDPLFGERGNYAAAIEKLTAVVRPARLLMMFNEDLTTDVGMAQLWDFLGLKRVETNFDRRVHEGRPLAMTPDQRSRARSALLPQYKSVSAVFPVLPDAWRKSMEEVA
jgi:hypothetical protein